MTKYGGDVFIDATDVSSTFDRGINSLCYGDIHIFVVLIVAKVIHVALKQILRELTIPVIAPKSTISLLIAFVKRGKSLMEKLISSFSHWMR